MLISVLTIVEIYIFNSSFLIKEELLFFATKKKHELSRVLEENTTKK